MRDQSLEHAQSKRFTRSGKGVRGEQSARSVLSGTQNRMRAASWPGKKAGAVVGFDRRTYSPETRLAFYSF